VDLHAETVTQITIDITREIVHSHFTSSQADLLYSSVVLVSLRLLLPPVPLLICLGHLAYTPVSHPENCFECRCIHLEKLRTYKVKVSHIVADGQSASKSWRRAPSGAQDQIFITVWQLRSSFLWGALSDERTGLSFVYAAGPCHCSLSQVRVPWYSRPYFTVSDLRLPFPSPWTK
jgi:hypothetical protein